MPCRLCRTQEQTALLEPPLNLALVRLVPCFEVLDRSVDGLGCRIARGEGVGGKVHLPGLEETVRELSEATEILLLDHLGQADEERLQLGVEIPGCDSNEIVRVSRQNNSGTYVYFKEAVLGKKRDYKMGSRDMHGSKDVVDLVLNTPCAIGYSGLAYAVDEVRMPCISTAEGADCIAPSVETAIDRSYPIARPLLMYTAGQPEGAIKEYLDWILSDPGQCIIQAKGYAPVREVSCELD